MATIQRGLIPLLQDLDRRARPDRAARNQPIQKLASAIDTFQLSSETVTTTVNTGAYQWTKESYRSAVMTDTPVAYWRLGEWPPAGTANEENNLYQGTYGAAVALGSTGSGASEPNNSATFSQSTTSFVTLHASTNLNLRENVVVEAWARIDSTAANQPLVSRGTSESTGIEWLLTVEGVTPKFYAGNGVTTINATGAALSTGAWHHLIGRYASSSGAYLQVDGGAPTTSAATLAGPLVSDSTAPRIGNYASATTSGYFVGPIDEVAIYSAALSTTRGLAHYTAMTAPASPTNPLVWGAGQFKGMRYRTEVRRDTPLGYWRLGEQATAVTANDDSSGAARHGTFQSGYRLGSSGAILADPNTAAWSTGASGLFSVTHSTVLNPTAITMEVWVNPQVLAATTGSLVNKGTTAGYELRLNSSGSVSFRDRGATNVLTSTALLSTGTWYHIVAVGATSGLSIYLNGSSEATSTTAYGSPNSTSVLEIGGASTVPLNVNAILDEVALYGSALSTTRITEHYLAGTVSS